MKLSGRERGLIVLLAVVAVVGGLRLWLGSTSGGNLGVRGGRTAGQLAQADRGEEVARLRIDDLNRLTPRMEVGRNPFRYAPVREVKPPAAPVPRAKPVQRPTRPSGPQPPRMTLQYVGRFGPKELTIAVFTDGDSIFNARQGDVVDGKFIVDRIGYESADIKFVGFPDVPATRLAVGG